MAKKRVLGILVGGGPAPGINGVIGAATIRAINAGFRVVGIYDGWAGLMGKVRLQTTNLEIDHVSRIHFLGGSILRTDRASPVKEGRIPKVANALERLGITHLLSIGGDDTVSVASAVSKQGKLRVIHVPKTIDNDLPLPPGVPTFGFSTACQLGGELVKNLMADAYVAKRWFFVEVMGRQAGHLALGIGKSAGVPLILIPEIFRKNTDLQRMVDIISGSIIKRLAADRPDGVVVYTEGIPEKLDPRIVKQQIGDIPVDANGHPRWSEVDFLFHLKGLVLNRLDSLGTDNVSISTERIGYTLRCADPIPFDRELTRELGLSAIEQLEVGRTDCMVTIQSDKVVCIPFRKMIDPTTGRSKIRLVNKSGHPYKVAKQLMIQLSPEDLQGDRLRHLAAVTKLSPRRFKKEFISVV